MEEAEVGVHQCDAKLVACIDDHLVSCGARGSSDVFDTTLKEGGAKEREDFRHLDKVKES